MGADSVKSCLFPKCLSVYLAPIGAARPKQETHHHLGGWKRIKEYVSIGSPKTNPSRQWARHFLHRCSFHRCGSHRCFFYRWTPLRSILFLLPALVLINLFAVTPLAYAKKSVVVLRISGPRGGQAAQTIAGVLRGRYHIVKSGRFLSAAQKHGFNVNQAKGLSQTARYMRVDGIITGSILRIGPRWVLKLTIISGHSGRPVGSATIPLRSIRLDPIAARRIPSAVSGSLARARSGPPLEGGGGAVHHSRRVTERSSRTKRQRRVVPPRRTPPAEPHVVEENVAEPSPPQPSPESNQAPAPSPGGTNEPASQNPDDMNKEYKSSPQIFQDGSRGDTFGFEVNKRKPKRVKAVPRYKSFHKKKESRSRIRKKTNRRPSWEKIIELSAGIMAISRSFDFNDPIFPEDVRQHPNYRSGLVMALLAEGALYPLAIFSKGVLANIGIVARYYRVLGLKSQYTPNMEPVSTTLHTFEAGLQYRYNIFGKVKSPTLKIGTELGRMAFVIWDNPDAPINLPDVTYFYLKLLSLQLDYPFFRAKELLLGASANTDYLQVISAGEIQRTDSSGYGRGYIGGIDIGLGLFGSYGNFFLRANGFYRRFFYDFNNACFMSNLGCNAAGGALDIYMGLNLLLGYAY